MIPKIKKKHQQKRTSKLKQILPVLLFALIPVLSIPKTTTHFRPITIAQIPTTQTIQQLTETTAKDTTARVLDITTLEASKIAKRTDSLKDELIKEIDDYIDKIAPKSKLRGRTIAEGCLEHNIEPAFVLAQSQIECHFGTTGSARKTNSAWNVGAYDGKSVQWMASKGFAYKHPDDSFEPYLSLLENRYLVNGRTIHHLMRNYVSVGGHRYASSKSYETELKKTYNDIKSSTKINQLYNQLKKEA